MTTPPDGQPHPTHLYVCEDGPRDAPALLLIHGSAASTRSWDALVPLLTGVHRVIRIDLLGHGRSAEPADDDGYAIPEQARHVGLALDRLGVEHAVVVGHSSGGYTATALAEQRPDLVTALAFINTGPSMDAFIAPETGAATGATAAATAGAAAGAAAGATAGAAAISPAQWPPTDEQIRHFASSGFREGYVIPQDLVDELRGMSYHALTTAMRSSTAYLAQRALPDRLIPLGKPVHVIFGDQDRRWHPSSAAAYRKVPNAHVEWLPGAGHTPIVEAPTRTAALLLPFTRAFLCA